MSGEETEKEAIAVRLSWLEKAQELSDTLATPHRLFDVDAVKRDSGQADPVVTMQLIFIECANTGVRAPLQRFHCQLTSEMGEPQKVQFQVDLIHGLIDLAPRI